MPLFTLVTHTKDLSQSVCVHFRHFWHWPHSSSSWSSTNKPAHHKHMASASPSLSFHHPPSSSDPQQTPNSLDIEISGFISLLPVFTMGFDRPRFSTGNGSSFAVFRLLLTTFSQGYLGQVSFLPRSLGRPKRKWVDNIRMNLQDVGCGYMDWIGLARDRDRWRTLVSAVMNLRVLWNAGNSLTSCKPISCSGRTLQHGVSK